MGYVSSGRVPPILPTKVEKRCQNKTWLLEMVPRSDSPRDFGWKKTPESAWFFGMFHHFFTFLGGFKKGMISVFFLQCLCLRGEIQDTESQKKKTNLAEGGSNNLHVFFWASRGGWFQSPVFNWNSQLPPCFQGLEVCSGRNGGKCFWTGSIVTNGRIWPSSHHVTIVTSPPPAIHGQEFGMWVILPRKLTASLPLKNGWLEEDPASFWNGPFF